MTRILWSLSIPALVLPACGAEADPTPATAVIAGEWHAPSDLEGADELLHLDENGDGDATLYRVTLAVTTRLEYTVAAEQGDDAEHFRLSFRCEGRWFMCETYDFDTECWVDDDDQLICEAPEWRANEDVIAFTRA